MNLLRKSCFTAFLTLLLMPVFLHSQTMQVYPVACTGCPDSTHSNLFRLTVDDLPYPDTSVFRYFWYFGDGTFRIIPAGAGNGPTVFHRYDGIGDFSPLVVVTQLNKYEDVPPPARVVYENDTSIVRITVDSLSSLTYRNDITETNNAFEIFPSTERAVPGQPMMYAIQYRNGCRSKDIIDSLFIEFSSPLNFLATLPNSHVDFGTIRWKAFNGEQVQSFAYTYGKWLQTNGLLSKESNTIFVLGKMAEDSTLVDSTVHITGNVFTSPAGGDPFCGASPSDDLGQTVALSHDPNEELTDLGLYCEEQNPGKLVYTVRFQNTGNAPTDTITIKVWIDNKLEVATVPNLIATSFDGVLAPADIERIPSDASGTWLKWKLKGAQLRGTAEPGFHQYFDEEDTRGFIQFTIEKKADATFKPCSMIPSQAEIVFDCNPPILTNPVFTSIACGLADPVGQTECDPCKNIIAPQPFYVELPPISFGGDTIIDMQSDQLEFLIDNVHNQFTDFKWFPQENIDDPSREDANYFGDPLRSLPYFYLIASTGDNDTLGCENIVYRIIADWPDCDYLSLNLQPADTTLCEVGFYPRIRASVSSAIPGMEPFTWQDCSQGAVWKEDNVVAGRYTVFVRDRLGCFAQDEIVVEKHPKLWVEDDPSDCKGQLVITGGTPPYQVTWPDNAFTGTATTLIDFTAMPNLIGKVFVEDSKGCVASTKFGPSATCPTAE